MGAACGAADVAPVGGINRINGASDLVSAPENLKKAGNIGSTIVLAEDDRAAAQRTI